jgi:hypothetical protein
MLMEMTAINVQEREAQKKHWEELGGLLREGGQLHIECIVAPSETDFPV